MLPNVIPRGLHLPPVVFMAHLGDAKKFSGSKEKTWFPTHPPSVGGYLSSVIINAIGYEPLDIAIYLILPSCASELPV